MGGSHEFRLQGPGGELRVHQSNGEVHVHNDKVKFAFPAKDFSKEYFALKARIIDAMEAGDDFPLQSHLMDDRGTKLVASKKADGSGIEWSLDASGAKVIPGGFDKMDDFVGKL